MKNKKWIAMLCTAALAVTMLAGCGGDGDEATGSAAAEGSASGEGSNVVVVGTNPAFAPFEYQDDEGNMIGFDLDLMEAIGEDQGFDVEFQSMEFDALIGALTTGQVDAVAAGMSINADRNNVLFSDPYMDASLGIMVSADNTDINSADDLEGKTVSAQIGTTGADKVTEMEEAGTVTAKLVDNYNTCIQDLMNGGCDAIIIDIPVADAYLAEHEGEVKLTGEPYAADYYGIAVDEENQELLDKINTGLANIIENGTLDELCEKYDLDVPASVKDGSAKDAVAEIMSAAE